jgi:hypothetical protein
MARREFGALTHVITDCGRLPDLGVDAKTSMVRSGRPSGFSTVHIEGRQFGKRDVEMVVFLVNGWLEESQIKDRSTTFCGLAPWCQSGVAEGRWVELGRELGKCFR